MNAYACRLTAENIPAIASEHPKFSRKELADWVDKHGSGYFVRDEDRPAFDCRYMMEETLTQIYDFERGNESALFRRLVRRH